MDNEPIERDKNGDVVFPKVPEGFWEKQNKERWTHVFHFKSPDGFFLEVDYEKMPFEDMRQDLPKFDLIEERIFSAPDTRPSDDWFRWRDTYDYYLETFFRPVLARGLSEQGFPLKVDFFKLVLPKKKLAEITQFIEECGLSAHRDFILYLIAKIEFIYIHDIEFHDRPEERKRIKEFPAQIEKLISVLKFSETNYQSKPSDKPRPELEQVTFHYNTEEPVKITHPQLLYSITKSTREHFEEGKRNDWEKQLRAFPNIYTENQMPNQFRYRICKALHNFFKAAKVFEYGGKETTDNEVYAIAKILDFAHIKFHGRKNREFDIDIDKVDILKNVRHAITRKELVYHPTHFTEQQLHPDLEMLRKYFDQELISGGATVYNEYDLRVVGTITDRFGLNKLLPEIVHLFNCLKQRSSQVGHQFECLINREIEENADYQAWKTLIKVSNGNIKLQSLQFAVEGQEKAYSLSERLSMEIMEKALEEYYRNHPFEFEVDFYESKVELHQPPGSFRLVTSGKLHQPHNRFFSKFCKQCYAFLLNENPPGDRDWKPSERYLGCIGQLLLQSYFFKHQMWDEQHVMEQVQYWFGLSEHVSS